MRKAVYATRYAKGRSIYFREGDMNTRGVSSPSRAHPLRGLRAGGRMATSRQSLKAQDAPSVSTRTERNSRACFTRLFMVVVEHSSHFEVQDTDGNPTFQKLFKLAHARTARAVSLNSAFGELVFPSVVYALQNIKKCIMKLTQTETTDLYCILKTFEKGYQRELHPEEKKLVKKLTDFIRPITELWLDESPF